MEELNKTQIVLLTLFVTFVTSIATGIVTVTLLSQAPKGVTNVIDHVVEKTIEKVVPSDIAGQMATVVREKVKVVTTEDLVVAAIARNQGSVWAIRGIPVGSLESNEATFYGLGFVLSKDGVLVADVSAVQEGVSYRASDATGKSVKLSFIKSDAKHSLAFFQMQLTDADKSSIVPVSVGDANTLKIGQSIVAVGGRDKNVVSVGIVSSVDMQKIGSTTTNIIGAIYTTTDLKPLYTGSLLINSSGEVVGFYRYLGDFGNYFPLPNVKELQTLTTPPAPAAAKS
jgi:S1-C subfamily serine protease